MNESTFDLDSAVALFVILAVMIVVLIRIVPVLVGVIWQLLPGILLLWFVVAVLRGMVKKLFG